MAACRECGAALEGGTCARCARINAIMPGALEAPPPIEIPGPPSPLANTLSATVGERPNELARFAAALPAPVDDTVECPRCAERIKARAKACRFCGVDIEAGERREEPRRRLRRRSGMSYERAMQNWSPLVITLLVVAILGGTAYWWFFVHPPYGLTSDEWETTKSLVAKDIAIQESCGHRMADDEVGERVRFWVRQIKADRGR